MKITDTTLDNIKKYFDDIDHKFGTIRADYDKEHPNVLNIFRPVEEADNKENTYTYVCGVYKDKDDKVLVKTETTTSSLDWGEGYMEDNDYSIEDIIGIILTTVKAGICEYIDYQKEHVEFINNFGKQYGLTINPVKTESGNKYE